MDEFKTTKETKHKKKKGRIALIIIGLIIAVFAIIITIQQNSYNKKTYSQATAVITDTDLTAEEIANALTLLQGIDSYKDSTERINEIVDIAKTKLDDAVTAKNIDEAKALLEIENIKNAVDYNSYNTYISAVEQEQESVSDAYELYKQIAEDFFDTKSRIEAIEKYLPYDGTYKIREISGATYSDGNTIDSTKESPSYEIDLNIALKEGSPYAKISYSDLKEFDYITKESSLRFSAVNGCIIPLQQNQSGDYYGEDINNKNNYETSEYINIIISDKGMTLNQYRNLGYDYTSMVIANFDKVEK